MALLIDNQMPSPTRQRLKIFVPRIVGTNEGSDGVVISRFWTGVMKRILVGTDDDRGLGAPGHGEGRRFP